MSISYSKHVNQEQQNRIEFLFVNFDYYDGNDLVAKILKEKFGLKCEGKTEDTFYTLKTLSKKSVHYYLYWHEDVGNYIYCDNQDPEVIDELEKMVSTSVKELNGLPLIKTSKSVIL